MIRCKLCNQELASQYFLTKHRRTQHPEDFKKRAKKPINLSSASELFIAGEASIRQALREVDAERSIIQQKLLDLDNLAAKYSKFINPNGR